MTAVKEYKYTNEELEAIDRIIKEEKSTANRYKLGKEFTKYLESL